MFKLNMKIIFFFFSILISTSAFSQSNNGIKEIVSSQQEKILTIESTLKKLIGSIEEREINKGLNQSGKLIENQLNSINETIKLLKSKINNITNLTYDLDFSMKRIERHLELSSINNKNKNKVEKDNLGVKPEYSKNKEIEIDKKSLDSKTNGVLGFIKEPSNKLKKNNQLASVNKKIDKKNISILPKGSADYQYNFAQDVALSGDYVKAEKALKEFLIIHKDHNRRADAQYMLGRVYYNQDKYEEATFELAKFNGSYPSDPRFQKSTLLIAEAVVNFATKKQACDILKQSLEFMQNQTEKFKTRLNFLINEKQCSTE